jgi:tRNA wybutosine-synthesizing protein 4
MIISECVLIYMDTKDSDALIQWFGNNFTTSIFLLYEQIKPEDPFGKEMVKNIEARGCRLKSIHTYPSLEHQKERFLQRGKKISREL